MRLFDFLDLMSGAMPDVMPVLAVGMLWILGVFITPTTGVGMTPISSSVKHPKKR
jgi:hypothetical protein